MSNGNGVNLTDKLFFGRKMEDSKINCNFDREESVISLEQESSSRQPSLKKKITPELGVFHKKQSLSDSSDKESPSIQSMPLNTPSVDKEVVVKDTSIKFKTRQFLKQMKKLAHKDYKTDKSLLSEVVVELNEDHHKHPHNHHNSKFLHPNNAGGGQPNNNSKSSLENSKISKMAKNLISPDLSNQSPQHRLKSRSMAHSQKFKSFRSELGGETERSLIGGMEDASMYSYALGHPEDAESEAPGKITSRKGKNVTFQDMDKIKMTKKIKADLKKKELDDLTKQNKELFNKRSQLKFHVGFCDYLRLLLPGWCDPKYSKRDIFYEVIFFSFYTIFHFKKKNSNFLSQKFKITITKLKTPLKKNSSSQKKKYLKFNREEK